MLRRARKECSKVHVRSNLSTLKQRKPCEPVGRNLASREGQGLVAKVVMSLPLAWARSKFLIHVTQAGRAGSLSLSLMGPRSDQDCRGQWVSGRIVQSQGGEALEFEVRRNPDFLAVCGVTPPEVHNKGCCIDFFFYLCSLQRMFLDCTMPKAGQEFYPRGHRNTGDVPAAAFAEARPTLA